ncbi:50S ribosomal protein L22 [Candidatus Saccharibacteria bacterium]|nr:50S ribosomal protein L22 [Candidatus Saccharibacteria bacterium]
MKQVQATAKNVRISPRKVSLVASLVRGRTVADALVILDHVPKKGANPVSKVIASAAANAVENSKMDKKTLQLHTIEVTNGITMKRFRPAARGRALPYKHRSCNIKVVVSGEAKAVKASKTATEKKPVKSVKKEEK